MIGMSGIPFAVDDDLPERWAGHRGQCGHRQDLCTRRPGHPVPGRVGDLRLRAADRHLHPGGHQRAPGTGPRAVDRGGRPARAGPEGPRDDRSARHPVSGVDSGPWLHVPASGWPSPNSTPPPSPPSTGLPPRSATPSDDSGCGPRRPAGRRGRRPETTDLCRRAGRGGHGRRPRRRAAPCWSSPGDRQAAGRPGWSSSPGPTIRVPRADRSCLRNWSCSQCPGSGGAPATAGRRVSTVFSPTFVTHSGPASMSAVDALRDGSRWRSSTSSRTPTRCSGDLRAALRGGESGTALVVVGDPKQAIYGFRGGDIET